MSIASGIIIDIAPDGSRAVIQRLPHKLANGLAVDVESVVELLIDEKIVYGIDRPAIEAAVACALEKNQDIDNVQVASARLVNEIVSFVHKGKISQQEYIGEIELFKSLHDFMADPDEEEIEFEKAYWVKGNTVLYEIYPADGQDVLGNKKVFPKLPIELIAGQGVVCDRQVGKSRFVCDSCGFVAVDENHKIHVLSPFVITEDRMSVLLKLVPVASEDMIEDVIGYISDNYNSMVIAQCRLMSLEEVLSLVRDFYQSNEGFLVEEVATGRSATDGIPGYIEFMVNLSGRPDVDDEERVRFCEFTSYCMVQQDQPLAKVVHPVQGKPGIDVAGNVVGCEVLDEPTLEIEDSIKVIENETERILTAVDNGCLIYSDDRIRITDTIMIDGNVGPESGSIKKGASSVIIKGNVQGGYSVESDGDIIIEGSIENGARIRCKNLSVHKGVFGSKSDIYVTGNAEVGYIQGGKIRVLGNLVVMRYVMEGQVTCRGDMQIMGQGINGTERGALIGGDLSVLGSLTLHSVGSVSEVTRVICGLDSYLYDKLLLCRNAMSGLDTEVARIQHSIGFNVGSPDAVERLRKMSAEQKQSVAGKLEKIKSLLAQVAVYEQQCQKVESVAVARDLRSLRIKIDRHVVPVSVFSIGINQLEIKSRLKSVSIRLRGNEVIAEAD